MLVSPSPNGFLSRNRFIILFCSLLLFLVSVPVVQELRLADRAVLPNAVESAAFFIVLAAALVSVAQSPSWKYFIVVLGGPVLVLGMLQLFFASDVLAVTRSLFAVAFIVYVIIVLVFFVSASRNVTMNTVCAALCVYLLLAVTWAVAYSMMDIMDPTAIQSSGGRDDLLLRIGRGGGANVLYFSLCTLTTLGYGDIVPVSPSARMLAALESVIGQLYLAVLVARLVGLQIAESMNQSRGGS